MEKTFLKCLINGKEYDIAQGATFSEEYNETLDSATIVLPHVEKIPELRPYDDVLILGNEIPNTNTHKIVSTPFFTCQVEFVKLSGQQYCLKISKEQAKDLIENENMILLGADYYKSENAYRLSASMHDNKLIYMYWKKESNGKRALIFKFSGFTFTIDIIFNKEEESEVYNVFENGEIKNGTYVDDNGEESIYGEFGFESNPVDFTNAINEGIVPFKINRYETKINENHYTFFKHFLVDSYNEEFLRLESPSLFTYRINLFSETKGLEAIILPSISVTEPLIKEKKKSIYEYLVQFLETFSPKIKVKTQDYGGGITWRYFPKYRLATNSDCLDNELSIYSIFGNVYSPDFTLTNPTLRSLLEQFFITKDMIPYVRNGVIFALDKTKRRNEFSKEDLKFVNYISGSNSSSEYADSLKTNFSNGLSQDHSCKVLEDLMFRNSSTALMSLSNARLETRFPIYKINKITMSYYKKFYITRTDSDAFEEKIFKITQDITDFVRLETERNVLSLDWKQFNDDFAKVFNHQQELIDYYERGTPMSNTNVDIRLEDFTKYKMCTMGYSIGSNYITGWGDKFSYPRTWEINGTGYSFNSLETTYIGNLCLLLDTIRPYGTQSEDYFLLKLNQENLDTSFSYSHIMPYTSDILGNLTRDLKLEVDSNDAKEFLFASNLILSYGSISEKYKGLMFNVDYTAFYNGAIVQSKFNGRDEIVKNDNGSTSLSLMEKIGLYQKEKINRMGNKTFRINARYTDIKDLKNLGDVLNTEEETDIVIYHREFSVFENMITASYYGVKDHVLKNFFTSVYAKQRTWALMPYGESVNRCENCKTSIVISKKRQYNENATSDFVVKDLSDTALFGKVFSFVSPSPTIESINEVPSNDKINFGYIKYKDKYYISDVNAFVSGTNMCFNVKMFDNVSAGVNIKDKTAFPDVLSGTEYAPPIKIGNHLLDLNGPLTELVNMSAAGVKKLFMDVDLFTGSSQEWNLVVDEETGNADDIKFGVCHLDMNILTDNFSKKDIFNADVPSRTEIEKYSEVIDARPMIDLGNNENSISINIENGNKIYKDNKDVIDMTFQIEVATDIEDENNFVISPLALQLSELIASKPKAINTHQEVGIDFGGDSTTIGEAQYNVLWSSKAIRGGVFPEINFDAVAFYDFLRLSYNRCPFGILSQLKINKAQYDALEVNDSVNFTFDFSEESTIDNDSKGKNVWTHGFNDIIIKAIFNFEKVVNKDSNGITFRGIAEYWIKPYSQGVSLEKTRTRYLKDSFNVSFLKLEEDENVDYYLFRPSYTNVVENANYVSPRINKFDVTKDAEHLTFYGKQFFFKNPNVNELELYDSSVTTELLSPRDSDYENAYNNPSNFATTNIEKSNLTIIEGNLNNYLIELYKEKIDQTFVYQERDYISTINYSNNYPNGLNLTSVISGEIKEGFILLSDIIKICPSQQNKIVVSADKLKEAINLINNSDNLNNYDSLRVWYLDAPLEKLTLINVVGGKGKFKFVFGVNFDKNESGEVIDTQYYLSRLNSKDTRIFDCDHIQVGEIKNEIPLDNE